MHASIGAIVLANLFKLDERGRIADRTGISPSGT
jgi:hypothetical protein